MLFIQCQLYRAWNQRTVLSRFEKGIQRFHILLSNQFVGCRGRVLHPARDIFKRDRHAGNIGWRRRGRVFLYRRRAFILLSVLFSGSSSLPPRSHFLKDIFRSWKKGYPGSPCVTESHVCRGVEDYCAATGLVLALVR